MTSRKLTSGFDFWSRVISATPSCISPYNLMQDIFIQSKVIDIFSEIQDGGRSHLGFSVYRIWPFRCVDSVVFVLCTKFGLNICYSHWDRHIYASKLHLMTLRELTSGFDFGDVVISGSPWCIFPYNLMQISLSSTKLLTFCFSHNLNIQDGGDRHLGFSDYVNLAMPACWQRGICVMYQIWIKYLLLSLKSTHLCFWLSFDDVTRINFGFDFWSRGYLRVATMHLPIKFGAGIFI